LRDKPYPSELCCILLSYAASFCDSLHPTELRLTLNELSGTLKIKCPPPPPPPPIAASLILLTKYTEKNPWNFQKQNASLQAQTRSVRGVYLSNGPPRLWYVIFPGRRPTQRRGILCIKALVVLWKDIALGSLSLSLKRSILFLEIKQGFLCTFCRKDQQSCVGWVRGGGEVVDI
jgi:hypothetical protein